LWYLPLALMLLWFWQDMATMMTVRTIPYSEFKEHLANGEVKQCEVRTDEIVGRIEPKRPTKPAASVTKDSHPGPGAARASKASRKAPDEASRQRIGLGHERRQPRKAQDGPW